MQSIVLAALVLLAIPAQGALSDGLVSFWPFETVADGLTPDLVASNHFSMVGDPVIGAGRRGSALILNGTSTYLTNLHGTNPAEAGLPIYPTGSFTVTMWVKGPAQTAKYLYAEGSTANNNPLFIIQTGQTAANNALLDVIIRADGGGAAGTPVNHRVSTAVVFDDQWHHLVWADNQGEVRLYIDGILDGTSFTYTPTGTYTMNSTAVGTLVRAAISTGAIFNGSIDELAVWRRALTEPEVADLFANGLPLEIQEVAPSLDAPLADATRRQGDWVLFAPSLSGTRPFTYQWFRNGEAIPGATEEQLRISGLTGADSGATFSIRVSNALGTVTSEPARLTVESDPAPNVREGLLNYWPLDEALAEGEKLISPDEYSGNDMVLVDFAGPADVMPGQFGNALQFDFISRLAYRTNGSPIYNNTNYSVSFWVKAPAETQNDRRVFSEGSSLNNNPLFTIGTDPSGTSPSARVFIRGDGGENTVVNGRPSARPVFDDVWHHVVWTDQNGQGRLYIDGVLDNTDYTYTRVPLTLDITSLGAVLRAVPSNFYFGLMDEAATWNRVLSWTEIQQIMTNGIPERLAAIAPAITTEPTSRTNAVFAGDDASFAVQYTGTLPIDFQWYLNGLAISAAQNPSAKTDTLTLEDVQVSSGGELYVVLTNTAGAVTSSIAQLAVTPYTPRTSGEVLKVDIGQIGTETRQPGFAEMNLAMNGTNFNGVGVTLSGIGGAALAERNRATGARITNNPPSMTQAQIYDDFVFANNQTDGTGLRITISRLAPNTPHELTLWSYDPQSTGDRISDWNEISLGTPISITNFYTFNGSVQPTNDFEYTMTATLTSSPAGRLVIEGTRNGGTSVAAFVNAIRLVANPGLGVSITGVARVNERIRITVEAGSAGQMVALQQASNLGTPTWTAASGGTVVEQNGLSTVFEFPTTGAQMFYRAVTNPNP